jgi:tartrate dehydrogenase/decarboxylase/D-malate dehydrogenase
MPEGVRVLEAAASRFGIGLEFDHFDFACWPYFERHGSMMPDDWQARIGGHDAILFGAGRLAGEDSRPRLALGVAAQVQARLRPLRELAPARLMPGCGSPLAGLAPGDIDMMIVRENTEGEYSAIGGRMYPGTEREVVVQETVMSRVGVDRILKFAFELAQSPAEEAPHLGDQVERHRDHDAVLGRARRGDGRRLSEVRVDRYHIDILTAISCSGRRSSTPSSPATCSATS